MSIYCAPTLESTSSLISIFPSCLGAIGTCARWLFKKSCLRYNNKLQAARGNSWELIVFSWTRFFAVRVTEFAWNSRDLSKPSLKTEKVMLLLCWLEVYKLRREMNFWLTVSTIGELERLSYRRNKFCLLWIKFGYASLWLAKKNFKNVDGNLFFIVATGFYAKQCVPLPPNIIIVNFWSVKGILSPREQIWQFLQSKKLELYLIER